MHASGFFLIGLLHLAAYALPARAGSAMGDEIAATAAAAKVGVVDYVQVFGTWPPPAEPTIVGTPADYAGTWIERLDLLGGGTLRITLNSAAGGGLVLLRPHEDLSAWDCFSPDVVDVDQHLDGCVWAGPAIGAELLATVGAPKVALAEYHANHGVLPAAGEAEVVGTPSSYAGVWVERLDLLDGGVLRLTLESDVGAGRVDFRAAVSAGPITWECTSGTIAAIDAILPGCTWTGP